MGWEFKHGQGPVVGAATFGIGAMSAQEKYAQQARKDIRLDQKRYDDYAFEQARMDERERDRQFTLDRDELSRQFATDERLGRQDFMTGERLGRQDFALDQMAFGDQLSRENYEFKLTAKQRQEEQRFLDSLSRIENDDSFTDSEKQEARRRVLAGLAGIQPMPQRREYAQGRGIGDQWVQDGSAYTRGADGIPRRLGDDASQRNRMEAWKMAMSAAEDGITGGVNMQKAQEIYQQIMGGNAPMPQVPGGIPTQGPAPASFDRNLQSESSQQLMKSLPDYYNETAQPQNLMTGDAEIGIKQKMFEEEVMNQQRLGKDPQNALESAKAITEKRFKKEGKERAAVIKEVQEMGIPDLRTATSEAQRIRDAIEINLQDHEMKDGFMYGLDKDIKKALEGIQKIESGTVTQKEYKKIKDDLKWFKRSMEHAKELQKISAWERSEVNESLPHPKNKDEVQRLSPGQKFIDPNGKERVR